MSRKREPEAEALYKVVVGHEEQYSIWPADRENALGWQDAGKSGTREECEVFIKKAAKGKLPPRPRRKADDAGGGERGGGPM